MSSAVDLGDGVLWIVTAVTVGERDVRWSKVGSVEHHDTVVGEELHVHSRDSDVGEEEIPYSSGGECYVTC
ncbi:hypothetical protein Bca4012_055851 [Brassica carinata]